MANVASQPFAAFASQLPEPALHVKPQVSAAHVAVAFAGIVQAVHAAPHAVGSFVTHLAPQTWPGATHEMPHTSFVQVAAPAAGTGHTVQSGPHAVGSVFAGHLPLHAWNAALHVKPQVPSVHVVVEFVTTGHLMLQPPQWFVLVLGSTQVLLQLSGADGVQPLVQEKPEPTAVQSGVATPHAALHAPQVSGFEKSTSQPSLGSALQFA